MSRRLASNYHRRLATFDIHRHDDLRPPSPGGKALSFCSNRVGDSRWARINICKSCTARSRATCSAFCCA
ncbi:hypothetical protein KM043_003000 [Ampulex compressa]|nr:hypothetical protein KM043_003000 [Ampulex compressa]